jgi:hypothetical protein
VLEDLVESGLVYRAGRGAHASYRVATPADLDYVKGNGAEADGVDALVWGVVYRLGPVARDAIAAQIALPAQALDASLERLLDAARILRTEKDGVASYRAEGFVLSLGESVGWEAAVFDHFQALVATVCAKLRADAGATPDDHIGGSTYTLEVWEGHPFEDEALGELRAFRARLSELRRRIAAHNSGVTMPAARSRVMIYGGQCVVNIEEDNE